MMPKWSREICESKTHYKTWGGYWVPLEKKDKYNNEKITYDILEEMFSKEDFVYSQYELIEIIKRNQNFDYSQVDSTKLIPNQIKVLESIIHTLCIDIHRPTCGNQDSGVLLAEMGGEKIYAYPRGKYKHCQDILKLHLRSDKGTNCYYYSSLGFPKETRVCGIYKITNIKTGKCYIGQAGDISARWFSHTTAKDNNKFHSELKKSLTDFTFEIVEKCNPLVLDLKEVEYIEKYDSFKNGYNANRGPITKAQMIKEWFEKNPEMKKLLY